MVKAHSYKNLTFRDPIGCAFDELGGGGSASNAHIIMESQRRCVGVLLYCAR